MDQTGAILYLKMALNITATGSTVAQDLTKVERIGKNIFNH